MDAESSAICYAWYVREQNMKNNKQLWANDKALKTAMLVSGGGKTRSASAATPELNQMYEAPPGARTAAARGAIDAANKVLDAAVVAIEQVIRTARKTGYVDIDATRVTATELLGSARRVPNALCWALGSHQRMPFMVRHSLGCAVNSLVFGCFLQFDDDELIDLAIGALLLDIGKIEVPVPLLAKAGKLSVEEQNFVRRHVTLGYRILETNPAMPRRSLEMVQQHHERIDGSGYPAGLSGAEISLFGQIAGIVDTYDAQCLKRWYARAVSAHDALRDLNAGRGSIFPEELVDKFICAIGVFPTGTWVQLVNGCIGVVCVQQPNDPMNPQVALVEGPSRRPMSAVKWLTLSDHSVTRALQPTERPVYFDSMEQTLQTTVYGLWPR